MSDFIDQVIRFILSHNEAFVQWTFVGVIAVAAVILGTSIFSKHVNDDPRATRADSADGTQQLTESSEAALGAQASVAINAELAQKTAQATAEVNQLKAELAKRAEEIEQLKTQSATASEENPEITNYLKKIKELEGKLAEYEILEDDIADLSLYKEENARLKAELQMAGATVAPAAAAAAPAVSPTIQSAAIVAEFEDVVEKTAAPAPAPAAPAPTAAAPEVSAAPAAASENEAAQTGDDLLSEFAASLQESDSGSGELDTDKMLAEVAALEATQGDGTSALEEESDIDKMAAEADKLLGSQS